jgi:hypothetical protein
MEIIEDITKLAAQYPHLDFYFSNGMLHIERNGCRFE